MRSSVPRKRGDEPSAAAFAGMTDQVLESEQRRNSLKQILLGPGALYEALRQMGQAAQGQQPPA